MANPVKNTNATVVTHTKVVTYSPNSVSPSLFEALKILLPISLFFLGIVFSRLLERNKEKERLESLKKYFFFTLEPIILYSKNQIKELESTISNVDKFSTHEIKVHVVPTFHLNRFKAINDADFYKMFTNNKQASDEVLTKYIQILQALDYLDTSKESIVKSNTNSVDAVNDFTQKWNPTSNRLSALQNKILIEITKSPTAIIEDKTLTMIIAKRVNYLNTNSIILDKLDIDNYYLNFLKPVFDEAMKDASIYTNDTPLYREFELMVTLYVSFRQVRNEKIKFFKRIVTNMTGATDTLNQALDSYKNKII